MHSRLVIGTRLGFKLFNTEPDFVPVYKDGTYKLLFFLRINTEYHLNNIICNFLIKIWNSAPFFPRSSSTHPHNGNLAKIERVSDLTIDNIKYDHYLRTVLAGTFGHQTRDLREFS